jgi:hypothetical protein
MTSAPGLNLRGLRDAACRRCMRRSPSWVGIDWTAEEKCVESTSLLGVSASCVS